uniref:Ig-like domain-containing protein n=1 Tax=Naja naja TaxID=35670 RepID=A0A8C6X633_NAJNA
TGSGVVRPRDNLQLVCKVSGFSIQTQNYVWHWFHQPFGKTLEWIVGIHPYNGNKWYSPSVKNRASISSDGSKNEFYFQLNSVSVADAAVYFCSREDTMREVDLVLNKNGKHNNQNTFLLTNMPRGTVNGKFIVVLMKTLCIL